MGDKGSTILFLYGAPNSLEKKEEIGCHFLIELKDNLKKYFPDISFKAGMNSGNAFAGIVGGSGMYEYTVIGDSINFSARLMQSAEEFQIVTSEKIKEKGERIFKFNYLGERKFKGKTEEKKVYSLEERYKEREDEIKEIKLIGRKDEKEFILNCAKEVSSKNPILLFIEGEAGIGKTHVVEFILNELKKDEWEIFKEKGEITLKNNPYSIWKFILEKLLFDGKEIKKENLLKILKETDKSFKEFLPIHLEFFGIEECKLKIDEEKKRKCFTFKFQR